MTIDNGYMCILDIVFPLACNRADYILSGAIHEGHDIGGMKQVHQYL